MRHAARIEPELPIPTPSTPSSPAALPPRPYLGRGSALQRWAANFWLRHLHWCARHARWYAQGTKPFWMAMTWLFAGKLRQTTTANAARLLGPQSTPRRRRKLARRIIANFYQFIVDFGFNRHLSLAQLQAQIAEITGAENFQAARAPRRGIIVATAHFGSFEIGIAALRQHEAEVHVLYRPDPYDHFEAMRAQVRERLGVHAVSVDAGTATWLRLRDALARDEVVLIQADRVMPGQKGQAVPFLGGHMLLPIGPVKLALITGAPIVPIFSLRRPDGRLRLEIDPPIFVEDVPLAPGEPHPALLRLAQVIERHVSAHPEQWLVLQPAWLEDDPPAVVEPATR